MWVFRILDVTQQPALGYMEIVPRRDASTLSPIISQHVLPSTIVHSDEWRAYNRINTLPLVAAHKTVNHSVNFVDPGSGVHTHHIESYWNRVKTKLKKMKGCYRHMLPLYLDQSMWQERHGVTHAAAFAVITLDISQWYREP